MILKSKNNNFTKIKKLFQKNKINKDINELALSKKGPFGKKGFKYFIDYKDDNKTRPLCIFLPNTSAYRKDFDETKCMSFMIKDDELLEKYNEILGKFKHIIKKEFDKESVYNEKYLKAKIKSYNGKINTIFHNIKYQRKVLSLFVYQ